MRHVTKSLELAVGMTADADSRLAKRLSELRVWVARVGSHLDGRRIEAIGAINQLTDELLAEMRELDSELADIQRDLTGEDGVDILGALGYTPAGEPLPAMADLKPEDLPI